MKDIKVTAVCSNEYDGFEEVVADLPGFIENVSKAKGLHSALGYPSPDVYEKINSPAWSKPAA